MQDKNKLLILHSDSKAWVLSNLTFNEDSINGTITPINYLKLRHPVNPDGANRYSKKQPEILSEVHIYLSESLNREIGYVNIPTKNIKKIEIYEPDRGATTASWVFSSIGAGISVFAILLIIVALTKSSCPFVYTDDNSALTFSGEIFSGATQPGLERDDYLPLGNIAPREGTYKLKMTNEVHEIQSVNYTGLIMVDHPDGVSVLFDKNGILHTFKKTEQPVGAFSSSGENIMPFIKEKDTLSYSFNSGGKNGNGVEGVILQFQKPLQCNSAKLIVRAKNTFWLDMLLMRFHRLFGGYYDKFAGKQEKLSGKMLGEYMLDQKIPLLVYVEKNNKWQFADFINIAGPMALREDILSLDLSGINSDTIKIKLETGYLFWDLDFAAMDFGTDDALVPVEMPVRNATDKNGLDVKPDLLQKDNNYLVLKDPGDESMLYFDAPPQKTAERSVFLHSRGYYKILREQSGHADKKLLKTFRKPGRLPEFSKEIYDQSSHKNQIP